MNLRFTIRDLLWLTLVVALAVGWWINRRQLLASHERYRRNLGHVLNAPVVDADFLTIPAEGWTDERLEQSHQWVLKREEEAPVTPPWAVPESVNEGRHK